MKFLTKKERVKLYWKAAKNMTYIAGNRSVSPTIITWILTKRCNLTCKHCSSYLSKDKIKTDELMILAKKLAESDAMVIVLSGGEPLMVPNIKEIISLLKDHGKIVKINTNGLNLSSMADFLLEKEVDYIVVSIDGPDAASHDEIRGKKGSFDRAVEGLRYLQQHKSKGKPFLGIRGVVMKDNWNDIPQYMSVLNPIVDEITFQPIHNIPAHHEIVEESVLFAEEDKAIQAELQAVIDEVSLDYPDLDNSYFKSFPKFIFEPEKMEKQALHSCLLTWMNFMPVAEDGTCLSCTKEIGNLYQDDVKTIWSGNARMDFLRSMSRYGKCNTPCWLNCTGISPTWVGQGVKKMLSAGPLSKEAYESFKKMPQFTGYPSGDEGSKSSVEPVYGGDVF